MDAIKRTMEKEMNKRKKERKTNLHQQPTVMAMATATATENKKRCLHRDENCMVMCWSTSQANETAVFFVPRRYKAKQSKFYVSSEATECFVCGCVCTYLCVFASAGASVTIVHYMLPVAIWFSSWASDTYSYTSNDSAKPYHLFILLHTLTTNCGRYYYDKSVSIASDTVSSLV